MLQKWKTRAPLLGVVVLLLALAGWLAAARTGRNGFDWPAFRAAFRGLNWWWLSLGLAWSWSTYLVRALRWQVLLGPKRPADRLGPLVSATVIGFSAVTVLGRAGEMVRPYLIARTRNVPFPSQIAAWIVERIYDVLMALAIFGFAMTQVSAAQTGATLSWALRVGGVAIVAGTAGCVGILLLMRYRSHQLERRALRMIGFLEAHHFDRVERMIVSFLNGFRSVSNQGAMLRMILYTFAEWVLVGACYACVIRAFGGGVGLAPAEVLVLMGFATFGSLVQLPAVGGGVQVTVVLVLTEIFGFPVELATSVGLLVWFLLWVAILPVGVLLAVRQGITWAGVREATRVAETNELS
jgi:uncharacterized protein (TIRG00374 family)